MMGKKICGILLFFSSFGMPGCVDEYTLPDDVKLNYEQEVVIEGRLLSGEESVFYVTRTLQLNSAWTQDIVTDAKITVMGQNGYVSEPAEYIEDAKYMLNTGELSQNTLYTVVVEVDGETYESEPQPLLVSPEIDAVTYKEHPDNSVSLHVTTLGNEESSRYYMWTYEEDWEIHAEIDFLRFYPSIHRQKVIYDENYYPGIEGTNNPYYYCWGHDTSNTLNIYTTADLIENSVKEHELFRIDKGDVRMGYIYSLLLKQWSLTAEGYEYYRLMKLYTEESDGLFTPMPSDVRGNIVCTSNPEKGVRGFIIASNVQEKRMFVFKEDFKLDSEGYYVNKECYSGEPNPEDSKEEMLRDLQLKLKQGYVMYNSRPVVDRGVIWYTPDCMDCRKTPKATKTRPEWWPNDHR